MIRPPLLKSAVSLPGAAVVMVVLLIVSHGCQESSPVATTTSQSAATPNRVAAAAGHDIPTVAEEEAVQPSRSEWTTEDEQVGDDAVRPVVVARRQRPADTRTLHDAEELARAGIGTYESRRLRLHTDIEPEVARTLPRLMDAACEVWESYFGALPPDPDGTDFQMTGYLMRDQQLFRDLGLLPRRLRTFLHGRHRGQEFWMNDQEFAYYRRHLMVHEGTHCFMAALGGIGDVPIWYLEGMAELFATHHMEGDGTVTLATMPARSEDYVGFGRIQMIRRESDEGRAMTVEELLRLPADRFGYEGHHYAWSWALCRFLDAHPRYQDEFRNLARTYPITGFASASDRLLASEQSTLETEWMLFIRHLCYGFDIERAAMDFPATRPCAVGETVEVRVDSSRGWQSSLIRAEPGGRYRVAASGQVVLGSQPRPWVSEAQGISIRYSEGRPIGRLLGMVLTRPTQPGGSGAQVAQVLDLGRESVFTAESAGTLFLCVNDFWDQRADNHGHFVVSITRE